MQLYMYILLAIKSDEFWIAIADLNEETAKTLKSEKDKSELWLNNKFLFEIIIYFDFVKIHINHFQFTELPIRIIE